MQLYSGDHRVRCSLSITTVCGIGREELEEKSAVHPAQRMAINMPTCSRYGVYFNRNLQTTTEYFFICNLLISCR